MTKCVYRDLRHHFLSCAMLPYRATRYIMNSPSPPNTTQDADSQATLRGSSRNRMWRSVVVGMATVVVSIITIVMATESGKRDIVRKQLKILLRESARFQFPESKSFSRVEAEGNRIAWGELEYYWLPQCFLYYTDIQTTDQKKIKFKKI